MEEDENVIYLLDPGEYTGNILFFFENGKAARVELSAYATKTNRKKLTGAYSDKSPVATVLPLFEETDLAVFSTDGRVVIFNSALIAPKSTRSTQGVNVISLKRRCIVEKALPPSETHIVNISRYKVRSIPAAGALLKPEDKGEEQLSLIENQQK
jgi:DNA gyrase subunit A